MAQVGKIPFCTFVYLLEQNDENILPRQARDEHENEMPGLTNGAKHGFLELYQNRFHVKSS